MNSRALIYLVWGQQHVDQVLESMKQTAPLTECDVFIITDRYSSVEYDDVQVITVDFVLPGLLRKTELYKYLPEGYEVYLFLDSDTRIIGDISLGFEQALKHGIAAAPAPHYSLDYFFGFSKVMQNEGISAKGQLQYNTGVIFLKNSPEVLEVLKKWCDLGTKYQEVRKNDQPFFTLAMALLNFNPYTLSISFNYRGFGDAISGVVRVWHSHHEMPDDINEFKLVWPPRRVAGGKMIRPAEKPAKK